MAICTLIGGFMITCTLIGSLVASRYRLRDNVNKLVPIVMVMDTQTLM